MIILNYTEIFSGLKTKSHLDYGLLSSTLLFYINRPSIRHYVEVVST